MASFILRNVDTALWTAARQACKAEGRDLVAVVESYLAKWLSGDPQHITGVSMQYAKKENDK